MPKRPTQRSVIVPRETATGASGLAQTFGAIGNFFGGEAARVQKQEEVQLEKDNKKANADLTRLISTNPVAARALKESGDFGAFFKSVGHEIDPKLLELKPVTSALRKTLGTNFAVQGRSDLRDALNNAPPGQTTDETISNYIKTNTQGMSAEGANAFTGATLKFAEADSIAVAERRRRIANKAQRDKAKANFGAFLDNNTDWTEEGVSVVIDEQTEVYARTGLDPVTARVKAQEDYEREVLRAKAVGEAWADTASRVSYGGRPPMIESNKFKNLLGDANAESLREKLRLHGEGELRDVQTVRGMWRRAKASGSSADLSRFSVSLSAAINKNRKGEVLAPEWESLLDKLSSLHAAGAGKATEFQRVVNGLSYDSRETTEWLMGPAGHAAIAKFYKLTDPGEIHRRVISHVAKQSAGGFGKKLKAIYTQDILGQDDPDIAVPAINDILLAEQMQPDLPGVGRFYTKEGEHVVQFVRNHMAGVDNIPGTGDDTDPRAAFKAYRATVDFNDGVLPTRGYLSNRLKFKQSAIVVAENGAVSRLQELLGDDVELGGNTKLLANNSLTMAAWEFSRTLKFGDSLAGNEQIIERAAQLMRGKLEANVEIDADGDPALIMAPRTSSQSIVTLDQAEVFKQNALATIPSFWTQDGIGFKSDEFTDDGSRLVTRKDATGHSVPVLMDPGTPLDIPMDGENSLMVTSGFLKITARSPAAAEGAGLITVEPPGIPERGEEIKLIGNGMFARFDGRGWTLRTMTPGDITRISSAAQADVVRTQEIKRHGRKLTKKLLQAEVDIGATSEKAADETNLDQDPSDAIREAQARTVLDGTIFDATANPTIANISQNIQGFGAMQPTPVSRKFHTKQIDGPDRIIGHSFNLDRADAKGHMTDAGITNIKAVLLGKKALTPVEMNELQKVSVRATLVDLRKRIGKEAMAAMTPHQLETLTAMIETASYGPKGRSDVLNPAMVKALQERRYELVATLAEAGMASVGAGFDLSKLSKMSDADLHMAAMTKPGVFKIGAEIGKRKLAGTYDPTAAKSQKRLVQMPSVLVAFAAQAVSMAFRPSVILGEDADLASLIGP